MRNQLLQLLSIITLAGPLLSCGAGIPVQLRIDEFSIDVNTEDWISTAEETLKSTGFLSGDSIGIPEKWPNSLPDIRYDLEIISPSIPLDLTPEPDAESSSDQYTQLNTAQKVIERIEINELILRVDRTSLSLDLPTLELQIADTLDAHPDNRSAWTTIGILEGAKAGQVGDIPFKFVRGGETCLNTQLFEPEREFSLRVKGRMTIDTEVNPNRPNGQARFRLIALTTFYLIPRNAL